MMPRDPQDNLPAKRSSIPALIASARSALANAHTLGDVIDVRERAKAIRRLVKGVKGARAAFNECGELVIEAFAKEGEELAKINLSQGGNPTLTRSSREQVAPTLAELGINSRKESMVAQMIAAIPGDILRAHFDEVKAADGEITIAGALRLAANATRQGRLDEVRARELAAPDGTYDVIVIDPPWPMEKIERDVRPNQSAMLDYPIMTEDELRALEIPAADSCHVWLWTPNRFLPMAFRLLDAWQLRYVCLFVWRKPGGFQPIGLPQYNCEFALYARRGSPQFVDSKAFNCCFDAPRGAHSEKPEAFYEVVRRVTAGRRLDMFNRREIAGFIGWGKEAAAA